MVRERFEEIKFGREQWTLRTVTCTLEGLLISVYVLESMWDGALQGAANQLMTLPR